MLPPPPPLDWEEPAFFSMASCPKRPINRKIPPLKPGEVHLACWKLALSDRRQNELLPLLNEEEQARTNRFTQKRLAASFVAARTGLRVWLSEFLDCLPTEIEFEYGYKGKPRLASKLIPFSSPNLEFNLAHSGELAVLAIANEPIGVDIERHRALRSADGMAKRWYSDAEQKRIAKQPSDDQLAEFFHIWSLKESILKLVGSGVGESLPSLETPNEPSGGKTSPPPNNQLNLTTCWAQPIEVVTGYSTAIALSNQPLAINWLGCES